MKITFVKTRHHYDSYIDFWRFVELSEFPTIYVDELDVSQNGVFIVAPINGEWRPHIDNQANKKRNAHLIHWNLERPSGSAGSIGQYAADGRELQANRYIDNIWHSDRRLATETGQEFIVLGSDERLAIEGDNTKRYVFCHLSALTDRRKRIIDQFDQASIGPNSWDNERAAVLRQSKYALNIHQDNHPYMEPLRLALYAAYGLPIISESLIDSYPLVDGEHIITAAYNEIPKRLRIESGENYGHSLPMGERCKQLLCHDYNFKKMVEKKVSESVGWR